MSPAERQHRLRVITAFGLVYLLWGSTYLGIRIAIYDVPPAIMAGTRFFIAGSLMLAWCVLTGRRIRMNRRDFLRVGSVGVLLLTGGNVGVAWSELYLASGLAALIVAAVPIWVTVIESVLLRGDRLSRRGLFGLALGIVGLAILLGPKLKAARLGSPMELVAALVLVAASFSWATGSVHSRRWKLDVDPISATAWQMVIAGVVNIALGFALGEYPHVHWTLRGVGAIAYLIVFGSWIGHTAYIWLLNHVPTPKVATYAYVNPVVAVFLGWVVLNERVDAFILAGAAVIIAAVALVNTSRVIQPKLTTAPAAAQPALSALETGSD